MNNNNIVTKSFTCLHDFTRINAFLCETYQLYGTVHNWDIGRWTFNRYCVHGQEELSGHREWENYVKIWETTDQQIIAVAHIEEPVDYFFQVHPNYTYLEADMLSWAIKTSLGKLFVHTRSSDWNRKQLYKKFQGVKQEFTDPSREILLKHKITPIELPQGFTITYLDHENSSSCEKISQLYSRIWPTSSYLPNGATVKSLTSSPIYRTDLSFIVMAPNADFAAFCFVWLDDLNHTGHVYPLGTDPDYVGMNLNQGLLENALGKLQGMNCEKVVIGGYYEAPEIDLFQRLGFQELEPIECYEIPK